MTTAAHIMPVGKLCTMMDACGIDYDKNLMADILECTFDISHQKFFDIEVGLGGQDLLGFDPTGLEAFIAAWKKYVAFINVYESDESSSDESDTPVKKIQLAYDVDSPATSSDDDDDEPQPVAVKIFRPEPKKGLPMPRRPVVKAVAKAHPLPELQPLLDDLEAEYSFNAAVIRSNDPDPSKVEQPLLLTNEQLSDLKIFIKNSYRTNDAFQREIISLTEKPAFIYNQIYIKELSLYLVITFAELLKFMNEIFEEFGRFPANLNIYQANQSNILTHGGSKSYRFAHKISNLNVISPNTLKDSVSPGTYEEFRPSWNNLRNRRAAIMVGRYLITANEYQGTSATYVNMTAGDQGNWELIPDNRIMFAPITPVKSAKDSVYPILPFGVKRTMGSYISERPPYDQQTYSSYFNQLFDAGYYNITMDMVHYRNIKRYSSNVAISHGFRKGEGYYKVWDYRTRTPYANPLAQ